MAPRPFTAGEVKTHLIQRLDFFPLTPLSALLPPFPPSICEVISQRNLLNALLTRGLLPSLPAPGLYSTGFLFFPSLLLVSSLLAPHPHPQRQRPSWSSGPVIPWWRVHTIAQYSLAITLSPGSPPLSHSSTIYHNTPFSHVHRLAPSLRTHSMCAHKHERSPISTNYTPINI